MTKAEALRLFAYTRWANGRMLDTVQTLSDEQFRRDLKSSFPSVHATIVHTMSADWIWLERWQGRSPTGWPEGDAMQAVAQLRDRWNRLEDDRAAYLRALDEAALQRPIAYKNLKGQPFNEPLEYQVQHAANHGSFHRGQVITMLRQLGAKPVATDFIVFEREHPRT